MLLLDCHSWGGGILGITLIAGSWLPWPSLLDHNGYGLIYGTAVITGNHRIEQLEVTFRIQIYDKKLQENAFLEKNDHLMIMMIIIIIIIIIIIVIIIITVIVIIIAIVITF